MANWSRNTYITRADAVCLDCGNTTAYVNRFGTVVCEKCDSTSVVDEGGDAFKANDFLYPRERTMKVAIQCYQVKGADGKWKGAKHRPDCPYCVAPTEEPRCPNCGSTEGFIVREQATNQSWWLECLACGAHITKEEL